MYKRAIYIYFTLRSTPTPYPAKMPKRLAFCLPSPTLHKKKASKPDSGKRFPCTGNPSLVYAAKAFRDLELREMIWDE